ncbi:MAG: hypothetical protein IT204_26280 [Fimbriimonadaceae bacterium]|nr:hypothetical protein [Fimbriimonadaceae bacterium]
MPARQNSLIEPIIQRICDAADPAQPYARQLEQVAGAAVEQGLNLAETWPAMRVAGSLRTKIETAVSHFAAAQDRVDQTARRTGVTKADILAGLVLKHCHEDLEPLAPEEVARYGLHFALALAAREPRLAARYRGRRRRPPPPRRGSRPTKNSGKSVR